MLKEDKPSSSGLSGWIYHRLRLMFGLDLRSLAFFRIMFGLIVIGDLYDRSWDLHAHYTDDGLVPRWWVYQYYTQPQYINFHAINGSWLYQACLFLFHAVCAFCFAIGYRTKFFQFLTWMLLNSLQIHNPVVGHGGDVYFRVMIFFGLFLPLGKMYSVDRFLEDRAKRAEGEPIHEPTGPHRYLICNLATAAFIAQIMIMYIISVYHKNGREWVETYTATYYALNLDFFRLPLGDFFLSFGNSNFLKFMTWAVHRWEYWGSYLMISPFFTEYMRAFSVLGFMALHTGFGACLRLGLFFWCTTFAVSALIPPFVWELATKYFLSQKASLKEKAEDNTVVTGKSTTLYYDPHSLFSIDVARAANDFLLFGYGKVVPVDSLNKLEEGTQESGDAVGSEDVDIEKEKLRHSTFSSSCIALEMGGARYQNLDALIALTKSNPITKFPAWVVSKLTPNRWASNIKRRINHVLLSYYAESLSTNYQHTSPHKKFGKHKPMSLFQNIMYTCGVKANIKEEEVVSIACNVVAFGMICFVLSWNLSNLGYHQYGPPPFIKPLGWLLRVDQSWGMFSPHPPKSVWWHVIKANLSDDTVVEIFKDRGMFNWEASAEVVPGYDLFAPAKPFAPSYGNHRWFKFWENGFNSQVEDIRLNTGRYICREWNSRHSGGKRLWQFWIYLVVDNVHEDGSRTRQGEWIQWSHQCYDSKPTN